MKIVLTLFATDVKLIKHWFKTSRVSKMLVLSGFALVFALISLFIFSFTRVFFQTLATFEDFGLLTSHYIIHASIILIIWLGIGSSITSTISLFLYPNKHLSYLISLPVKPRHIVYWVFIKTTVFNTLFLFVLFIPIALAFFLSFWETISFSFVIRVVLALTTIVLLTNTSGGLIAYTLAERINRYKTLLTFISALVFFLSMFLIFKIVVPQNLKLLYDASPENFITLYNSLPLSSPLLPTSIITKTITEGITSSSLLLTFFVVALAILVVQIQSHYFIGILQKLSSRSNLTSISRSYTNTFTKTKYPLVIKDLLSILRVSSETGYALFLLGMLIFFFILFSSLYAIGRVKSEWNNQLILFSFIWFEFFVTSYLLRLVFPLMARESTSSWYLFSLPLTIERILKAKIATSILVGLPLLILSTIIWLILPFAIKPPLIYLILPTLLTTLMLSLLHTLLGAIKPNFKEGESGEKVSTSMMGIATLIQSAVFIIFISRLLNNFLKNQTYFLSGIEIGGLLVVFCLPVFLYYLALHLLKKQEY